MKSIFALTLAIILTGCASTYKPCDPERLNCDKVSERVLDNGTRSTGGKVSSPSRGPSESNNPGGLQGGGQVGNPGNNNPGNTNNNPGANNPGKGKGNNAGHGGKNHGSKGNHGKGGHGKGQGKGNHGGKGK